MWFHNCNIRKECLCHRVLRGKKDLGHRKCLVNTASVLPRCTNGVGLWATREKSTDHGLKCGKCFLLLSVLLCASFLLVLGNFLSPVGKGNHLGRVAEESLTAALPKAD